ncbi:MAG TPA: N-acetyl-gamma-glutamyl-phosphate reductase [Candidatus Tyrphobacter sp.]
MTAVHVWGASGYAAAEAIRLLERHPFVELGALESRSHAGERLGDHFPLLRKSERRFDEPGSVVERARPGDVVITAGAHGEAKALVQALLDAGVRVVDLSSDYRLDATAAYGLTEWNRAAIAQAPVVANPGCYATAALLALLPLAELGAPLQIVVDAKSGITGAGRNPVADSLFAEVSGEIRPYALDGHRHQPEMERALHVHALSAPLLFTPHVVPLSRGLLADAYVLYAKAPSPDATRAAFDAAYSGSPFIRVLGGARAPSAAGVAGSNDAELRIDVRSNAVRVLCAIDNLGKGAAGQAVQNLNVMLGYPEETSLGDRAIVA